MRHATWLKLQESPYWLDLYRVYRRLPEPVRAPLRFLVLPQWHVGGFLVRAASRGRVVAGPFRGMRLELSGVSSRHLLGYILGSQELELRKPIARIIERAYRTILNVGAAEGYYAVGLALRSPQTRVAAFETLKELHPLITRSARLNGVSGRVEVHGKCDLAGLRTELTRSTGPVLIVMDIEGGEIDLLDPEAVPQLRQTDILVETHDAFVNRVTETLIDRFWRTHNVECYTAQDRLVADFPPGFLSFLPRLCPQLAVALMEERRTGVQRWLFLTTKDVHGAVPDRKSDSP